MSYFTLRRQTGKFLLALVITAVFSPLTMLAQQVTVSASSGTATGTYTTLKSAFDAINAGTHTGAIDISINASTTEGTTPAVLNASGQGSADYISVMIRPTAVATISGNPASGSAVVRLDGADNVTINGDIAGGTVDRDLTIESTTATGTSNTAVVWLTGRTTLGLGARNFTIENTNLIGNDNSVATSHGIVLSGSSLTLTGYHHDVATINNNTIKRVARGIYVYSTTTASSRIDSLIVSNNVIGSNVTSDYISFYGIGLTAVNKAKIIGNEVFNVINNVSQNNYGIGATGTSDSIWVEGNLVYNVQNLSPNGWGAWGISMEGPSNTTIYNNVIHGVRGVNYNSTTYYNGFGIRLASGTGHRVYYNSVNLYDNVTLGSGNAVSAAFNVTATTVTGIDVRNNIFNNSQTSSIGAPQFLAVIFPASYNFANAILDNNSYNVPNTADHFVGRVGSVTYKTLADWRTVSQANNPTNDVNSYPPSNQAAPFTSNTNLTIPAGTSTYLESGGVLIPSLGTNTDFTGAVRPAGTGTAPDIGAYEFAGVPSDFQGADFNSVSHTPTTPQCAGTAHTVTADISDPSGVASANIVWSIDGVSQTDIPMTNTGGNIWTGTIPAAGSGTVDYQVEATDASINSNVSLSAPQTYYDVPFSVDLGADKTICSGDSVTLSSGNPVSITEVMQYRLGTGATPTFPSWATGADMVEFTNTGGYPITLDGWSFTVTGTGARNYSFPSGITLNGGEILILVMGTGTDDPANKYYHTGGSNDAISSTSPSGYILRNATGLIVDAVATNSHSFPVAEGVTTADWSGNIPSSSGLAGVSRNGADNNMASDWTLSSSSPQTIGSLNPGVTVAPSPTFTWSTGSSSPAITVAPATTTSYILTVSDGTCSYSDTLVVNVLAIPTAPAVTGDTICGQDSVLLQASGTGTLNWYDMASGGSIVNTGTSYSLFLSAADTFYVESDNGTCSGPRSMVAVEYMTPAPVSVTIANDTLCEGSSFNANASSSNASYVYTWSGAASGTGSSISGSPAASAVLSLSADDGNCTFADVFQITVVDLPMYTPVASQTVLCEGEPFTLSADPGDTVILGTGTSYNGSTTYPDPFGNYYEGAKHQILIRASELTAQGFQHGPLNTLAFQVLGMYSLDPLDNFTIRMGHTSMQTMTNWESGLTQVYTNTSYMPVAGWNVFNLNAPFIWDGTSNIVIETCFNNQNYDLNFGTAYSSTPFTSVIYYRADNVQDLCDSTLVTNTSSNRPNMVITRVNNLAYNWTPSAPLNIATGPVVTGVADTSRTFIVNITEPVFGCTYTDSVSITVNPTPLVDLGPDTGFCAGLNHLMDAGNPGATYSWSTGSASQMIVANTQGVYSVTVTNGFNCSAVDSVLVSEYALPVVDLGNDTAFCPGNSLTLDAGTDGVSFNWNTGAGSQTITVSSTGVYTVDVVDANGCENDDAIILTVYPGADVVLGADIETCNNSTVTLNAGGGFSNYQWSTGETTSNITVSTWAMNDDTLTYTVMVTTADGCTDSDTISVYVRNCNGISENSNVQVNVMPNPGTGLFTVDLNGASPAGVTFLVTDLTGRVITEGNFNDNRNVIDITSAATGVYNLVISANNERKVIRLVKH